MSAQETRQLLRAAPYFPVTNLEASAAHYEKVFGFRREYVGGTPPEFAILSRDGLPIMLKLVPASTRLSPNEQQAYNMEEFAVRDRDGYVLGFGQALDSNAER
jgi:hypothetical protein